MLFIEISALQCSAPLEGKSKEGEEGGNTAHHYVAELCSAACLGQGSAENKILGVPRYSSKVLAFHSAYMPMNCANHYLSVILLVDNSELFAHPFRPGCNRHGLQTTARAVLSFQVSVAL